jgi:hypothetical protein
MYGKSALSAYLIVGLFFLSALWAGQESQAIPVLPPLLLPHHQTITVDNFTGADRQNLSVLPDGSARLNYSERFWAGEFRVGVNDKRHCPTSVAAGPNGRYFLAWAQWTGEANGANIHGQVFEKGGNRIGGEIGLCTAMNIQYDPDVAYDGKGRFLIAWEDERDEFMGKYSIRAQVCDADGQMVGNEITVTTTSKFKGNVAVAGRPDGGFVLAWRDDRNGNPNIWGRFLDSSGTASAPEFEISSGVSVQDYPDVAVDGQGRFVAVWSVKEGGEYRIECQRFDAGGNKLGTNLVISSGQYSLSKPKIALSSKSDIIMVWEDSRNTDNKIDVYAARLDWNGNKLGSSLAVASGGGDQSNPALATDRRDYILVCWDDKTQFNSRIGSLLLGPQMEVAGDVRYLSSQAYSYIYTSLTSDREDTFMAGWASSGQDGSHATAAPYLQTFGKSGSLVTQTFAPQNLVRWGSMSARMTLGSPASTSILFELSTDSGTTWSAVPDNGSLAAAGGNALKLRALFSTSDNLVTPVLNNITLSYTWNTPPSVSAPATVNVKKGKEVTLSATGTDADFLDALSLTYAWNQTSGKALGLSNLTGRNLTFKPSSPGKYTFTVTAHDGFASSAPATVTLTVSEEKWGETGFPLMTVVILLVVVVVVVVLLAALMMRKKPATVIPYQPPPAQPYYQPPAPPPQAAPYAPLPAPAQPQTSPSNTPPQGSMGVAATIVPTGPQPANLPPSPPPQGAESQPYPPTNP